MIEIRNYKNEDINSINLMGKNMHDNYVFKLDEFSRCLVITMDNKLAGFITYSIIYDRAEIVDIYIDKEYRKQGFAKMLLSKVIDISMDNKCINITLEVNSNNTAAIGLYKKYGFELVSIRKAYYSDGSDGYLMKKDLR